MLLPFLAAIFLVYVFMWLSVLSVDDGLEARETGLAVVAARNPYRPGPGPPANMAKLILQRQKIQQITNRRRSPSQPRQPLRAFNNQPFSRQSSPWMRVGKAFGAKPFH